LVVENNIYIVPILFEDKFINLFNCSCFNLSTIINYVKIENFNDNGNGNGNGNGVPLYSCRRAAPRFLRGRGIDGRPIQQYRTNG